MADASLSLGNETKNPWECFNILVLSAKTINGNYDQEIKTKIFIAVSAF